MDLQNILIVAGEPSGDLHASNLVRDLKKLNPQLRFFGLGGSLSKEAGVEITLDISKLALVGAVEVARHALTIRKAFGSVLAKIDSTPPRLAILVDYPGFNLMLAKELHKRSIPIVYYVSPQVWAWGRGRIRSIKRYVKKMIVFFKFEDQMYKRYGLDSECVGHPLVDVVKVTVPKDEVIKKYGLSKEKKLIALLPGSRQLEVKSFLPVMTAACKIINERLADSQFIIVKHPDLPPGLYKETIDSAGIDIKISNGDTYNVLGASDMAIVASGTATLETAIAGTPLMIVYKVHFLTYILARLVKKIQFLGLVNIIAGREIAPELLQYDFTPEKVAGTATDILSDDKKMRAMREELAGIRSSLGSPGASQRAAKAILPFLQ